MEALTAGVLEKHDAIALKVKALTDGALKASTERMDDIEKKLNRGRLGGGWGDGDEGRKAAEAFARDVKARRGELKPISIRTRSISRKASRTASPSRSTCARTRRACRAQRRRR